MSDHTLTGRVVGGVYRITGFQRPGRMGDIYVGRRVDNNDIVSIKMLDPAMFGETEAIRRFERETRITTKLNHPCSLNVLDYGQTEDGLPWMVTEYVEGEVLSDVIEEEERLEPARAAYIAAQIAMALDAANAIGVVHRDVAPSNILITDAQGQADSVKVIEFGLSRLEEGGDEEGEPSALTAVGVRIGTPYYMAPEYIEEFSLDHRADLYSLGIVLFEMLTGSPPFTGRPYKVMDKHLTETPPPPSSVAPGVPEWLDSLVADLLEKDPDKRPQSGKAVVERIEAGLNERLATVSAPDPATPVAEQRKQEPEPAVDPILAGFIEVQVDSFKKGSGGVDPTDALLVHRVAAGSIAAEVGVKPGWLCSLPDEPSTGMREPGLWMNPVKRRHYVFASADGSERLDLKASGAEIGIELIRSAAHVEAHFDPSASDNRALLELWLQGDWETLERLTRKVLTQPRGAIGMLNKGLFGRFLGRGDTGGKQATDFKVREHPALVLHGAALIELGRVGEGMALVREYSIEHSGDFHPRYNGVASYYEAVDREKMGDRAGAVDLLVQGWLMFPNKRSKALIRQLTGKIPDSRSWYGRQFPDYTLDEVGRRGSTVNLYSLLMRLQDHQVWLVILMAGERANAEYEQVMRRYLDYSRHFGEFLQGAHLVTDAGVRDPSLAQWTAAEEEVAAGAAPFHVLEDYRGFVARAIKPNRAPVVYAVNRQGTVVHEGDLGPVELWEMLVDTLRLRRHM